jgi:endo-1,4-beta-xylanase
MAGAATLLPASGAMAGTRTSTSTATARPGTGHGEGLRELAARHGFWMGTAIHNPGLLDPGYRAILAKDFSIVSPENVMKYDTVEPERGLEDFSAAELIFVPAAERYGQRVRGHNLLWHAQLPGWLSGKTWTNDQLAAMAQQHITDEVSNFRGRIYAWDVVNEPLNDDGTMRQTLWSQALGADYIAQALQWAHAADPGARLYVNDYNLEPLGAKSDAMYALVQDLISRQIPIHGVGFQGHLGIQYPYPDTLPQNLQRFAALGIDVAITEADVRMVLPVTPDKLATQAQYFSSMLSAYLTLPHPVSFTVWGFTDAHSWVPGVFAGQGAATLYDENLQPKPAYDAMRAVLAG